MADLLPSSIDPSASEEAEPRVVDLDSEDAGDLMDVLSSETARSVLTELHDDPGTPSEVADRVDTSLQNAQYHLGNLEEAGVIEVVDTAYSAKGREMDVYAPADRPLVVFAGDEDEAGGLRSALARVLGAVGVLALASLVVQTVVGDGLFGSGTAGTGTGDGGGGPGIAEVTTTAVETGGTAAGGGLPPGLLFFLGGLTVLLLAVAVQYVRTR